MINNFSYFIIFVYLLLGLLHPVAGMNQDLGRHLIMGKIIISSKHVPKINLFSYTYPDFPFINHHWLSESIFYLLSQTIGIRGLFIFSLLITMTVIALLFLAIGKKGNPLALLTAATFTFPFIFQRSDIRPELFSYLIFTVFITLLYRYREEYTKLIFLLPILEVLWVNMHIYFPIGILLVGLFLTDNLLTGFCRIGHDLRNTKYGNSYRKRLAAYFLLLTAKRTLIIFSVLFGCCLATLLNPNGLSGALYPLHVFQNYGYTIEENQSIFFLAQLGYNQPVLPWFISASILLFASLLVAWKKTKPIDWLLTISFTYIGTSAVRNLPLFVLATFIPFVQNMSIIISKFYAINFSLSQETEGTNKNKLPISSSKFSSPTVQTIAFCILFAVMLWQLFSITSEKGFGLHVEEDAKNAADFYLSNHLSGPLFNNFDIGSYLDYRLSPGQKVFIDGRPEAYPATFLQHTYIPMQDNPEIFLLAENKYHFSTIFFNHTDQTPWAEKFLSNIIADKQWKIIYLDDFVVILIKDTATNKLLIQKYAMDPSHLKVTNLQKDNMLSLKELAHFFNAAGLRDQEKQIYFDILSLNPTYCPALNNLAVILSQESDPGASVYIYRYQNSCR